MRVIKIENVKARKPCRCDMCEKTIEEGEVYRKEYLVNDVPYIFRQCGRCLPYVDELMRLRRGKYNEDGLTQYEFMEFMWDQHCDIAKEWYNG